MALAGLVTTYPTILHLVLLDNLKWISVSPVGNFWWACCTTTESLYLLLYAAELRYPDGKRGHTVILASKL